MIPEERSPAGRLPKILMISAAPPHCNACRFVVFRVLSTTWVISWSGFGRSPFACRPDRAQFMDLEGVELDWPARDSGIETRGARVEVDRHGHVDQPVTGERFHARPVRVEDEPLLSPHERRRRYLAGHANLPLRRVV